VRCNGRADRRARRDVGSLRGDRAPPAALRRHEDGHRVLAVARLLEPASLSTDYWYSVTPVRWWREALASVDAVDRAAERHRVERTAGTLAEGRELRHVEVQPCALPEVA